MKHKTQRSDRNARRPFREASHEVNRRFERALRLARKGRYMVRVTACDGTLLSEEMRDELRG